MTGPGRACVLLLTLAFAGSAAAAPPRRSTQAPKGAQVQKPPAVKDAPKHLNQKSVSAAAPEEEPEKEETKKNPKSSAADAKKKHHEDEPAQ